MANFSGLTTQREEIIKKWMDYGLLDGLYTDNITSWTSQLINEVTETPSMGFENLQFPIVRRVGAITLFQDIEPHYLESKKNDLTPYNYIKKHKL